MDRLERLDLSLNDIGDAGAQALARAPLLDRLKELLLHLNDFGDAGALAMVESQRLQRLSRLTVSGELLRHATIGALIDRFGERLSLIDSGPPDGSLRLAGRAAGLLPGT